MNIEIPILSDNQLEQLRGALEEPDDGSWPTYTLN